MSFSYTVGEGFKKTLTDGKPIYRFSINGTVDLPNLTIIDSPRFNPESYSISGVRIIPKVAGTADYRIVIKSYGSLGGTETTHVDQTVSLTSKNITSITVTEGSIGANRSLQLEVQSLSGTPSEDITITII